MAAPREATIQQHGQARSFLQRVIAAVHVQCRVADELPHHPNIHIRIQARKFDLGLLGAFRLFWNREDHFAAAAGKSVGGPCGEAEKVTDSLIGFYVLSGQHIWEQGVIRVCVHTTFKP